MVEILIVVGKKIFVKFVGFENSMLVVCFGLFYWLDWVFNFGCYVGSFIWGWVVE